MAGLNADQAATPEAGRLNPCPLHLPLRQPLTGAPPVNRSSTGTVPGTVATGRLIRTRWAAVPLIAPSMTFPRFGAFRKTRSNPSARNSDEFLAGPLREPHAFTSRRRSARWFS
ncbi:MAG: hypothetical protein U1F83_15405 [Verrucomicrobiota bacterium]